MQFNAIAPVFLPPSIDEDANGPELEQLAKECFNTSTVGGVFSKKTLSPKEVITFSAEHTNEPLIKEIPKNHIKDAMVLQKAILKLTDVRKSKKFNGTCADLVAIANKHQSLKDEGYAVLIKQTNGSKGKDYIETMRILALWAKFVAPSKKIAPYLMAHLARQCKKTDMDVEMLRSAQFAYIRVSGKVNSHTTDTAKAEEINESINDIDNTTICFGVSLEEVMWHQRDIFPKLYVPYIMHRMANTFITMGCLKTEGIFRLPGNASRVDQCPGKANRGEDIFKGLDVKDIATLIKMWFRTIQGNIIPEKFAAEHIYGNSKEPHEIPAIADKLPFLHKCTLMYLIGFLRKLSEASNETNMTSANLAMTFAMSMTYVSDDEAVNTSSYIQCFLSALIDNWDVSSIYPLPQSMIT
jgi:hypothetical protein